jgi:flagellar motor protein MotB
MKRFSKIERPRKNTESWQIIYIDLMTNIMVFFVILWTLSQARHSKVINKMGDQTSRMVSLPGDVIFTPGKVFLSPDGKSVFKKLFSDDTGAVLNFEGNALTRRLLIIHGHTDGDGKKDKNFELGFGRALTAYHEISRYSKDVAEHVILCTHADNSPVQDVPSLKGKLTPLQRQALSEAKSKNRRISIEDFLESRVQTE